MTDNECIVCGSPTQDKLVLGNGDDVPYCPGLHDDTEILEALQDMESNGGDSSSTSGTEQDETPVGRSPEGSLPLQGDETGGGEPPKPKEELPTAAYLAKHRFPDTEHSPVEKFWKTDPTEIEDIGETSIESELVRHKDIENFFEIENLINQLAIAHRHIDRNKIAGKAKETNERLQRKLEEVQNQ